jgi:hypothetical protein
MSNQSQRKRGRPSASSEKTIPSTIAAAVVVTTGESAGGGVARPIRATTAKRAGQTVLTAPDRAIAAAVVSTTTTTQSVHQQPVIPEFPQSLPIDAVLLSCFGYFEPELMAMLEHFFAIHLNPQLADSVLVKSLHILSYQMRSAVDSHRTVFSDFQAVNRHVEVLNAGKLSLEEGNKQLRVSNNYFHIICFHVYLVS